MRTIEELRKIANEMNKSLEVLLYEMLNDAISENHKYKEVIDKAIELLGNYKHYSAPDEKQNSDNEDLVNKTFDILKEVK